MTGLRARDGFVERRARGKKKGPGGIIGAAIVFAILLVVLLLMTSSVYLGAAGETKIVSHSLSSGSMGTLGKGGSTPSICYGDENFMVVWFGKNSSGTWMLNATLMDAYGNVVNTTTISTDVALYNGKPSGMGPKVAYDPDSNIFFAIWYSSNKSLDGAFIAPTLRMVGSIFVINGTVGVDYHAFGLSFIGKDRFIVIWNDGKHDNYYRIVGYDNGTPVMGAISKISQDMRHSHLNDAVAYDSMTGNIMVIWRNSTGGSGDYNITGKIFDNTMSKVVRNDFTIANGFGDGKGYDIPNIAGGDGKFMVIYANRNSPYGVYGVLINATDGKIMNTFEIGESYKGVKYYGMGVTYNGSGGFMISWPGIDGNIMATMYSSNATKIAEYKITNSTDSMEAPAVSAGYMPTRASNVVYQFVWYDYTTGEVYTANYEGSVLVPEFSAVLPVLFVGIVALIVYRRKH